MPNPEKVYEGGPCGKCGGTLRWRSSRKCVECERVRSGERVRRKRQDPEYRRKEYDQQADYHRRMYWGSGPKHTIYRGGRALRGRRHAALKRQAERTKEV